MDAQTYLQKMKIIQDLLLKYVDDEADDQNIFNEFLNFIKTEKVQENIHLLTSMNHLLASIAAHHHNTLKFFDKIFKIILFIKDDLMKHYTNFEIYNFFNECKRVILFLIEEKIINVDSLIASKIIDKHQDRYFFPEIKQFITKKIFRYRGNVDNFEELRKVEYGDTYILQLVQRDSIDDFITYINQTNFKLDNYISSQFETNPSLIFGNGQKAAILRSVSSFAKNLIENIGSSLIFKNTTIFFEETKINSFKTTNITLFICFT